VTSPIDNRRTGRTEGRGLETWARLGNFTKCGNRGVEFFFCGPSERISLEIQASFSFL